MEEFGSRHIELNIVVSKVKELKEKKYILFRLKGNLNVCSLTIKKSGRANLICREIIIKG